MGLRLPQLLLFVAVVKTQLTTDFPACAVSFFYLVTRHIQLDSYTDRLASKSVNYSCKIAWTIHRIFRSSAVLLSER